MSVSLRLDTREFQQALKEYVAVSKKDAADACTHHLGNWALQAARLVKRGNKPAIQSLYKAEWWYRYVEKVIQKRGFTFTGRRKAKGDERSVGWRDPATGKWHATRKSVGTRRTIGGETENGGSRKDRGRVSRALLKRRAATVFSLVAALSYCGGAMGKLLGRVGHKRTPGANPRYIISGLVTKKATPTNMTTFFQAPFKGKTRETGEGDASGSAQKKVEFLTAALEAARPLVIADMREYVATKLARRAQEKSGRKA